MLIMCANAKISNTDFCRYTDRRYRGIRATTDGESCWTQIMHIGVCTVFEKDLHVRVRVVVDVPPPRIEEGTTPLLGPPPESGFMDMVQVFTSLNRSSPFAPVIGVMTTVQLWVKTPASL